MAVGDTLLIFTPLHNEPPASAPATLDTRNAHPTLDFDDTTREVAVFTAIMPRHYSGEDIGVRIHWAATSATTGEVTWKAGFERIDEDDLDIDADSFATERFGLLAQSTAPATAGQVRVTEVQFDKTHIDGIAVGDLFRLKIARQPDDAADDMSGDAELLAVEIVELDDSTVTAP